MIRMGFNNKKTKEGWDSAFYHSKIQELDYSARSEADVPSVYKKLRPFGVVGFLSGDFPIKYCFSSSAAAKLSFKKLSLHYIWSWILFLFKLFMVIYMLVVFSAIYVFQDLGLNQVDLGAWVIIYLSIICFGIIVHVLNVSRSKSLLDLIKMIDLYHDKYNCRLLPKIGSVKVKVCFLASVLVTSAPALLIYMGTRELLTVKAPFMKNFLSRIPVMLATTTIGMIPMEYSVFFYYLILFYLASVLSRDLGDIVRAIQVKAGVMTEALFAVKPYTFRGMGSEHVASNSVLRREIGRTRRPSIFPKSHFSTHQNLDLYFQKSWSAISKQYLDFLDVHDQYCNFIGLSFIVLFATLTVSLVCMVYCTGGDNQFNRDSGLTLDFIVAISFLRILFLADVGEIFERKQDEMIKLLMKAQQSANFLPEEKVQFKQLLVTATTIPVRLSAKGFFMVSRQNVTSIISVIITYIIVLVQFRMSYSSSSCCNCTSSNETLDLT